MDKEYVILENINNNSSITQRELSKKTGLSLGSVNILLNKMVREGLIKIHQIPVNRAMYILTPKGMAEKIEKTYTYIKNHYSFINETKCKIRNSIYSIINDGDKYCVVLENDEISELVKSEITGISSIEFTVVSQDLPSNKKYIVLSTKTYNQLKERGIFVINLLEML